MQKSDPSVLLKQMILQKEAEHELEGKILKNDFRLVYESFKPINIIKNTLKEAISSPDIKTSLVNSTIGMVTGYIAKKVFVGQTHNPLTKLFGLILETGISNKVSKNPDGIKSIGNNILEKIFSQFHNSEKHNG